MGDPAMGDPAMGDGSEPGMDEPKTPADEDKADDDVSLQLDEKIQIAIKKGVAWLKAHQLADGSWGQITGTHLYGGGKGEGYNHPAGPTALALYALLKCKESIEDPNVKRGFA